MLIDARLEAKAVTDIDEKVALLSWLGSCGINYDALLRELRMDDEAAILSSRYGLSEHEQIALYGYTLYGSDSLNQVLNDQCAFDNEIGRVAIIINKALDKLPDYTGDVVRREKDRYNILQTHVIGAIVTHYGFTSTTTGAEDVYEERPIRMVITSKTGKNIHWISYGKNYDGAEEYEVLISQPKRFLIIDRYPKEDYIEIVMQEVVE